MSPMIVATLLMLGGTAFAMGVCPTNLPAGLSVITLLNNAGLSAFGDTATTTTTTTAVPAALNGTYEWTISVSTPINVPPSDSTSCSTNAYVSQYDGSNGCLNALANSTQAPQPSPTGCIWWFSTNDASVVAIVNITCDPAASANAAVPVMAPIAPVVRIGEESYFIAFSGASAAVCAPSPTTQSAVTTTAFVTTSQTGTSSVETFTEIPYATTTTGQPTTTSSTTEATSAFPTTITETETDTTTLDTTTTETPTTTAETIETTATATPIAPTTTTIPALGVCPSSIPPFEGFITQVFNGQQSSYLWTVSPTSPVNITPPTTTSCSTAGYVSQYVPEGNCTSVAAFQSSSPIPSPGGCSYNFNDNGTRVMAITVTCDPAAWAGLVMGSTVTVDIAAGVFYYLFTGTYAGVCSPSPSDKTTTTSGPTESVVTSTGTKTDATTEVQTTSVSPVTGTFPTTTSLTGTSSVDTFTMIPFTTTTFNTATATQNTGATTQETNTVTGTPTGAPTGTTTEGLTTSTVTGTSAFPTTTSLTGTSSVDTFTMIPFTTTTFNTGTAPPSQNTTSVAPTSAPTSVTSMTTTAPTQMINASFVTILDGFTLVNEIVTFLENANVAPPKVVAIGSTAPEVIFQGCYASLSANRTCFVAFGSSSDATQAVSGANSGKLANVYSASVVTPTTVAPTQPSGSSPKTGVIVGVVVGVVVGVFIVSAAVVYFRRRREGSQDGLYERINDGDSEIRSHH